MKARNIIYAFVGLFIVAMSSCSDFFDQDSDHVVFTDDKKLDNAGDTIYSLTGILQSLQSLGDRTVLLGELRGDLVSVTNAASADLRDIANFNVGDDNQYNSPRDYYAVINNCNFYIAKCDTALKDSRNEYVFMREYIAVKAIRAWVYLQLAINYGHVPFVTQPILTKAEAEATYPTQDINGICQYFIDDLTPLAAKQTALGLPQLNKIGSYDSRLLYFPVYYMLGELNLWAGNYKASAQAYYNYISTANGSNSYFPIGNVRAYWMSDSWLMNNYTSSQLYSPSESYSTDRELITMIPGDSLPSQGNYSQLRNIFNTSSDNDYAASVVPSTALKNLSAAQTYCYVTADKDVLYAPSDLDEENSGDLRLSCYWQHRSNAVQGDKTYDQQTIRKFNSRNIHIYRKTMAYLRMAEALNRAGYPHFAYQILARGVNNTVISNYVLPYCETAADSSFVSGFSFPSSATTGYRVYDRDDVSSTSTYNTIGIHSRGSGWACYNEYYQMPNDTTLTGDALKEYQIKAVEEMIVDENALECAFEGTRYYDLLRVALRRNDPSYLADKVNARNGSGASGIAKSLSSWADLFLSWQGKIGY